MPFSLAHTTKRSFKGPLLGSAVAQALVVLPLAAHAASVGNPLCPGEDVPFSPGNGQDINVPSGYKVSVFASGLNFPTGIAFRSMGDDGGFEVYVLESGHGLPSRCNDEIGWQNAHLPGNPFTPDILVFNSAGALLRTLGKPTDATSDTGGTNTFLPHGPAIDVAFEQGLAGGRLFATDSNQATHAHNGQNNSSRLVTVDPMTGKVTPFISNLPTGDHPSEQLAFRDGWVYWSQGSTTNSGVVGRDNGGGANQPDIPCQDIVLSGNNFDSGGGVFTAGYSPFGTTHAKGDVIDAFTGAAHHGVCDGAILRARLNAADPSSTIEPYSWGYRNGYAIRFAPSNHILKGNMLVGEDGADERGARPSNHAPDAMQIARQNDDGTPDYHGWPDRYGFLATTQHVYDPVGGPGDDLCVGANNPPSNCTPASLAQILAEDVPIRNVLDHPPQSITSPLFIEAADSSFTGIDFVPNSWAFGPVQRGAAAYVLEGDFGFSAANSGSDEVGHELKIVNFLDSEDGTIATNVIRFAKNKSGDEAFIDGSHGWNRPTQVRFGPDGCAWVTDYGAVRDFGQSGVDTKFKVPGDGPLLQIPGTGVIFRICRD
jgi:hypothetical protein